VSVRPQSEIARKKRSSVLKALLRYRRVRTLEAADALADAVEDLAYPTAVRGFARWLEEGLTRQRPLPLPSSPPP
jgi:hypothetical protein